MKLSMFADASLRAMVMLAALPPGEIRTAREVAEVIEVPVTHLSKAISRLSDFGLVEVARGRYGGAQLTAAGREASVGAVLRRLDPRSDLAECVSVEGNQCPLIADCALRSILAEAREAFYRSLDRHLIVDLPTPRQIHIMFPTIPVCTPVAAAL
ncbi:Rrf2 family nitric oxide-sensitive transcriptional repressor [Mycetocola sp. BIGb0189]|uniref:RrF2 family transcriptional regulator n=1 Tax=Mycetocola sp. BIGb0189 TaxID=2940604 RepID=UPI0021688457|nr:Rrf2 family transcriptional regulator [Mycetocola sp. BIGb0189]MCS4277573.1 Rrf2 family nitric oxide-sensitive transcriptional repressor [Mycetocola sp. BIGb0189]